MAFHQYETVIHKPTREKCVILEKMRDGTDNIYLLESEKKSPDTGCYLTYYVKADEMEPISK